MTAADKLRELLATRPRIGSLEEHIRWWFTGGDLVRDVLAEVDVLKQEVREIEQQRDTARAELGRVKVARNQACEMVLSADGMTISQYEIAHQLLEVGAVQRITVAGPQTPRDGGELTVIIGKRTVTVPVADGEPQSSVAERVAAAINDDESRCAVCGWQMADPVKGIMCHMIADTPDELHAMADRIGVARRWFQAPPKASFWHYDIAKSKRALAIAAGAIECDRVPFVTALRRIRESGVFGDLKAINQAAVR